MASNSPVVGFAVVGLLVAAGAGVAGWLLLSTGADAPASSPPDGVKEIEVAMPVAKAATGDGVDSVTVVSITKDGAIFLGGIAMTDRAQLEAQLREKRPQKVAVDADASVAHGKVVEVLDSIKLAGVQDVSFWARIPAPQPIPR